MEIKKNSFLWKIAYGFWNGDKETKTTNLCVFFWRVVAAFFIAIPIISIIGFLFAHGLSIKEDDGGVLTPYKKWFTIKRHRVYPITVLLILVVVLNIVRLGMYYGLKYLIYGIGALVGIVALACAILLIMNGFRKFRESEILQLVKSYIRAKKEKVCPTINFVD